MADDTKPKTDEVGPPKLVPPVKHPPETDPLDKSPETSGMAECLMKKKKNLRGVSSLHHMKQAMMPYPNSRRKLMRLPVKYSSENPDISIWTSSDQSKGFKHSNQLNDFGLVQHIVLVSPDLQPVHLIFDWNEKNFVYFTLIRELEIRTTLRQDHQKKGVTKSYDLQTESVTIVVSDTSGMVFEKKIVDAVHSSYVIRLRRKKLNPFCRSQLLQESCPHYTVIMYPEQGDEHQEQFWQTLSTVLSDQSKGFKHFNQLNDFGLTQHIVLVSPDLQPVHLIFDWNEKNFVYFTLIKELEIRTTLRQDHQKKGVTKSYDLQTESVTIVVSDVSDVVIEKMIVDAVHSSYVIHLRRKKWNPLCLSQLLQESCPHYTVIMYPEQGDEHQEQFWQTLSTFLSVQSKDVTRFNQLNDFGLVQHIVLGSSDIQLVHVIFDCTERDFVYLTLIRELETHTTLRHVHKEKGVTKSSDLQTESVTIVVCDVSDIDIEKMIVDVVGFVRSSYMIHLKRKMSIQLYLKRLLQRSCPHYTVMMYPEQGDEHQEQFWQTLSTVLSVKSKDVRRFNQLNDFGLVHHIVLGSSDIQLVHVIFDCTERDFVYLTLIRELETYTTLRHVHKEKGVTKSSDLQTESVAIVVCDISDIDIDMMIVDVVGFVRSSYMIHLKRKKSIPLLHSQLLKSICPHYTLTMYPEQGDEHQEQFWQTLSTVLSVESKDVTRFNQLNDIGLVQHIVLVSSDIQLVHVIFDYTERDFVYLTLIRELETHTTLRHIHQEKGVTKSSDLQTESVTIVVCDVSDIDIEKMIVDVVGFVRSSYMIHLKRKKSIPLRLSHFLQSSCPHYTETMYPEQGDEHQEQFWQTLSTVLSVESKDVTRFNQLNDIGLVQHIVLVSSDIQLVHVIFDYTERDFVYLTLIRELETHTTLRHIHQEKGVTKSSDLQTESVTIVVCDVSDIDIEKMIVDVVGFVRSSYMIHLKRKKSIPLRLSHFLQSSCPHYTETMYPEQGDEHQEQFWQTLSTVLSHQIKGVKKFTQLTQFGLVRHIVLMSPDLQPVHLIFDCNEKNFVYFTLIKELEIRTTLMQDHQKKGVTKSYHSQTESVTIVVSDVSDMVIEKKIVDAVGFVHSSYVIRLTKKWNPLCLSQLLQESCPHYTVIMYPEQGDEHREQFWQTLSTVLSDKCKDDFTRFSKLDAFSHHGYATLADEKWFVNDKNPRTSATGLWVTQSERTTEGHQSTKDLSLIVIPMEDDGGDQLKKDPRVTQTEDEGHQLTEDVKVIQTEDEGHQLTDIRVTQTEDEGHQLSGDVKVTPTKDENHQLTGDSKVSQTEEAVGGHQSAKDSRVTHVEEFDGGSQLLTVDPDRLNEDISDTDSDSDRHCSYCSSSSYSGSSQSSSDGEGGEHTKLSGLKTKAWQHPPDVEAQDPPTPIFSYTWQAKIQFDHEGGWFQRTGSDVKLYVPPGAVNGSGSIEVHSAVSVNMVSIRHLLKLSDKEQIASPLAEFWAGQDYRFQTPVSISLPHCLPKNFDLNLVSVYCVTRNISDEMIVERLDRIPSELSAGAEETLEMKDPNVAWNNKHCFQLVAGHIMVFTEHFSGYLCTYCQKWVKKGCKYKPDLYLMASGSISYPLSAELPASVDVDVHIWDARIFVEDFRLPKNIGLGPYRPVELVGHRSDSELELSMRNVSELNHQLDSQGHLLHAVETKCFNFRSVIGCKHCAAEQRLRPMSHQWAMLCERHHLERVKVVVQVTHRTSDHQNQSLTTLILKLEPLKPSAATQTDDRVVTDNTQVKQLASTTVSSVEGLANGSASGEQSHLALTQRSDNGATSHSMSHLQEACVNQQLAELRLSANPAGSGMNGTSSGSNRSSVIPESGPAVYTNCVFKVESQHYTNIQSAKATLNCGNTYTSNNNTLPAPEDANDTLPAPPQHQQLPQPPSAVPIVEDSTLPAPEDANDTLPASPQHQQLPQPPSAVPIVEDSTLPGPEDANDTLPAPPQHQQLPQAPIRCTDY